MKRRFTILFFLATALLPHPAQSWDAVGHRLSAAVALNYLSQPTRQLLLELLQQHPRYQVDFLDAMPPSISTGTQAQQLQWLLGQAAFWPDIARGLPDTEAARFNRPEWHYIDGAWVRDRASGQGNMYIGISPFPSIPGPSAASIRSAQQVDNIMTALDYNTRLLADASESTADRAVALCWVLHLMGDIHQPLHAGSLFSVTLFRDGDRGGNRIMTEAGNLHARWDRALTDSGINENLQQILDEQNQFSPPRITGMNSDWSQWLSESRGLLLTLVYTDAMKAAIAAADSQGSDLSTQRLDSRYVNTMQRLSRQRLGLAGLRIAIWMENTL